MQVEISIIDDGKKVEIYHGAGGRYATLGISVSNGVLRLTDSNASHPTWFNQDEFKDLVKEAYENYIAQTVVGTFVPQRFRYEVQPEKTMRKHMGNTLGPSKKKKV